MSQPERLGQSDFILICQRLHAAQIAAGTPDERDAADHELTMFLRYAGEGRLQEWVTSRGEQG